MKEHKLSNMLNKNFHPTQITNFQSQLHIIISRCMAGLINTQ